MLYFTKTYQVGTYYKVSTYESDYDYYGLRQGEYLLLFRNPISQVTPGTEPEKVYRRVSGQKWSWEKTSDLVMPDQTLLGSLQIPLDKFVFYQVIASRWGSSENHSYLVGSSRTLLGAQEMAEAEADCRGGKYECTVYECTLDSTDYRKVWNTKSPDFLIPDEN